MDERFVVTVEQPPAVGNAAVAVGWVESSSIAVEEEEEDGDDGSTSSPLSSGSES